jgi:ribosomal protein L6P/L9E
LVAEINTEIFCDHCLECESCDDNIFSKIKDHNKGVSYVKIDSEKNIITVQGTDKKFIGDFVSKIRNIKKPDAYKGKGFWLRNEIRPLKDIKKI